jgi:guanine deaminase
LFPERKGYLDVYDHYQLLGERSVFAHGVHLCDDECARLAETGSAISFCPTSNFFLGSGLFNLPMAEKHKLNVGLGTDVGGGTSFSLLQTLNEAYKVMQLQGARLSPFKSAVPGDPRRCAGTAWKTRSATCKRVPTPTSWCWTTTPRRLSYRLEAGQQHCRNVVCADTLGMTAQCSRRMAGALVHQR